MRVQRWPDPPTLAANVGSALLGLIQTLQRDGGHPQVVLTGGGIADAIHRSAAGQAACMMIDWSRVTFWFGDERHVSADSTDRNATAAKAAFLTPVGAKQVREWLDAEVSAEEAAADYAQRLRTECPGEFDLVMLGMGADGHVASLFPRSPTLAASGDTAVEHASPKPPAVRLTMTLPRLSRSQRVWFVVAGEEKADAAARAQAGEELPAAQVMGSLETVWHQA